MDEAGRMDLAAIVDEEAARLDSLIGEAVEMAEIDANVVQVHLAPQHPRALLELTVEESRKILASHRVTIAAETGRIKRTSRHGSIRICWGGFCGTCSKMLPVIHRQAAASR